MLNYNRYEWIGYLNYDGTQIGEIYWDFYESKKVYLFY